MEKRKVCPYCGMVLDSFSDKCSWCNTDLSTKSVSTVKDLANKLDKITDPKQRASIIKCHPVQGARGDIFDFMTLATASFDAYSYVSCTNEESESHAWLAKIEQCYNKGKILFGFSDDYNKLNTLYQSVISSIEAARRERSKTAQDLAKKLESTTNKNRRISIIKNQPIPNTKEEIFELMILATSNFDESIYLANLDTEDESDAWLSKIEQCHEKAKLVLKDSDELRQIEKLYQSVKLKIAKKKNEKVKKKVNKVLIPVISILSVCIIAFLTVMFVILSKRGAFNNNPNAIAVRKRSEDMIGHQYTDIVEFLEDRGFTNIVTISDGWHPTYDLGEITKIEIADVNYFYKVTKFDKDSRVVIYYASEPISIQMELVYDDLIGQDYNDVVDLLESKGFANITTRKDNWNLFKKSETVKAILINGVEGFEPTDTYLESDKITIVYWG